MVYLNQLRAHVLKFISMNDERNRASNSAAFSLMSFRLESLFQVTLGTLKSSLFVDVVWVSRVSPVKNRDSKCFL